MKCDHWWSLLAATTLTATTYAAPIAVAEVKRETPVDFAKDIHPLFKRSCFACHNTTKAKAGLNLESPQMILKGGDTGPAAIAGKGAESLLLKTASHAEDPAMPPPGNKVNATDFSPEELGLLKLWIDQGMKGGAVVENVAEWRSFPAEQAPVTAAALSASGRLAAAARGNRVQLTEVATGVSLGFLTDPELAKLDLYKDKAAADRDAVMAVAFGGDDLLATGGFRTARLWRRAPLAAQSTLELPNAATCLTTTGKWAAAGEASGTIRVWDVSAEKPAVQEWKEHTAAVKALCFSPDGQWLLSAADDKSFRVWSVAEQKVVYRAEAPAAVTALCFLRDGGELAAGFADGMLRVYPFPKEAPTMPPVPLREHKLGDQPVLSLAAPDAAGTRVLWTNAEPALHFTDTADGKRQDVALENPAQAGITAAERRQQAAKRHADARKARLAAAMEAVKKETESLRAAHQNQEKARADLQRKLEAARLAAESLRAAPEDGKRKEEAKKSADEADKAERAFTDARTNAELAVRLTSQAAQAHAAAEGAASAAETAAAETTATVESLKKTLTPLPVPKSITLLDSGKTALLAFESGRVQWHATTTGEFLDGAELAGAGPVMLHAGEAGGTILAARPDKKVQRLPARRAFVMERVIGKPDDASILSSRITALSFSSDARLLATGGGVPSRSGEVKLWRVADGSAVLTIPDPHSDTVNALAFSPDDSLIATAGSDRWARVFRTDDGKRTAAFEGHSGAVLSVGWRSDGLALATGGADKTLRYWDYLDAKQTRSVTSFGKEVSALAWLGTGDTVASASGDAGVRLNEEKLPGAQSFCFTVAADPAGKFVAAGGEDGVLRIWQAAAKKLLLELK
jgi:WD40 repeat protein